MAGGEAGPGAACEDFVGGLGVEPSPERLA